MPSNCLLTRMSMGRHPPTRHFGKIFVVANTLFVLLVIVRAVRSRSDEGDPWAVAFFVALLAYCVYEILAFTHGRSTSLDGVREDATPHRTAIRVFGLVLDVAIWLICVRVLKSW